MSYAQYKINHKEDNIFVSIETQIFISMFAL